MIENCCVNTNICKRFIVIYSKQNTIYNFHPHIRVIYTNHIFIQKIELKIQSICKQTNTTTLYKSYTTMGSGISLSKTQIDAIFERQQIQEKFNEYLLEYNAVDGYIIEDFSVEARYWKDIRNINTKIYQECKHARFP